MPKAYDNYVGGQWTKSVSGLIVLSNFIFVV